MHVSIEAKKIIAGICLFGMAVFMVFGWICVRSAPLVKDDDDHKDLDNQQKENNDDSN